MDVIIFKSHPWRQGAYYLLTRQTYPDISDAYAAYRMPEYLVYDANDKEATRRGPKTFSRCKVPDETKAFTPLKYFTTQSPTAGRLSCTKPNLR